MDFVGPKMVEPIERTLYTLIVRDDCSRYWRLYFLRHKSDASGQFEQFLADTRVGGVPFKVEIVRSDGNGELRREKFGDLRRSRGIKQGFTTDDSPQFNGAAERALGLIETAATAGPEFSLLRSFPPRNFSSLSRCGLQRPSGRAIL